MRSQLAPGGLGTMSQPTYVKHCGLARGCCAPLRTPSVARGCRRSGRAGRPPNPSPVRPPRTAAPSWLPPASTPGGACRLRGCGGRRWRGRERGPRPARALGASGAAKPRAIGSDRNQSAAGRTRTPQRSAGLPRGSKGGVPRQPLPGTREAWPQRVGWLSHLRVAQASPGVKAGRSPNDGSRPPRGPASIDLHCFRAVVRHGPMLRPPT